jgi:WD40 repeat-containing protein SMU1
LYLVNLKSQQLVKSYTPRPQSLPKLASFISAVFSSKGDYIYAPTENGNLVIFDTFKGSGREEDSFLKVSEREVLGLSHHPFANVMGVFDDEGDLKLWKA